jgi:hypothetical protein
MAAVRPKVHGSWNLHQLLPSEMDFFILLSSSAGIVGSRGQGNYCAGNSYQDALAHYRRQQGLPGTSIDLGIVLDVGFLASNTEERVSDNTNVWNFLGVREKELHMLVQAAITGESTPGRKVPTQFITGLGTGGMMNAANSKFPWWFTDSKFTHIKHVGTQNDSGASDDVQGIKLQSVLAQVTSMDEASDIVEAALAQKLAKSMMVDVENIDASRPISNYGVDSLLAVEIRSWLFEEVQADISVFELLSNIPIGALARKIASKSKYVPERISLSEE